MFYSNYYNLVSTKGTTNIATRNVSVPQNIPKLYVYGRGSDPDPARGAHNTPPEPLARLGEERIREKEERRGDERR